MVNIQELGKVEAHEQAPTGGGGDTLRCEARPHHQAVVPNGVMPSNSGWAAWLEPRVLPADLVPPTSPPPGGLLGGAGEWSVFTPRQIAVGQAPPQDVILLPEIVQGLDRPWHNMVIDALNTLKDGATAPVDSQAHPANTWLSTITLRARLPGRAQVEAVEVEIYVDAARAVPLIAGVTLKDAAGVRLELPFERLGLPLPASYPQIRVPHVLLATPLLETYLDVEAPPQQFHVAPTLPSGTATLSFISEAGLNQEVVLGLEIDLTGAWQARSASLVRPGVPPGTQSSPSPATAPTLYRVAANIDRFATNAMRASDAGALLTSRGVDVTLSRLVRDAHATFASANLAPTHGATSDPGKHVWSFDLTSAGVRYELKLYVQDLGAGNAEVLDARLAIGGRFPPWTGSPVPNEGLA